MPVGRKELERWGAAQAAKSRSSGAMAEIIKGAHASGTLNLSGKELREIPEQLLNWHVPIGSENWWEVEDLRKLDLSNNSIETLPEEMFSPLSMLQALQVGNNRLSDLPESMTLCSPTLTRLTLAHNMLTRIPPFFGSFTALLNLVLDHNRLQALPDTIAELQHVEVLSLGNNELVMLPDGIGEMRGLRELLAPSNQLRELPRSLGRLVNLSELQVSHNRLEELPELGELRRLVRLDLRENALRKPPVVPPSPLLVELLLGFNKLSALPRPLSNAPALSVLDLRDNCVAEVNYKALAALTSLKTLDLRNNELSRVPGELGLLSSLSSLLLEGNPLKAIRRGMLTAKTGALLEYLRGRIEVGGGEEERGEGVFGGRSKEEEVAVAVRVAAGSGKLSLREMGLGEVPEGAVELGEGLGEADLAGNCLEALPLEAGGWGGLRALDLSSNRLRNGPGIPIVGMTALTSLSIQRNVLRRFPEHLAALAALEHLDLSQNRMEEWPEGLLALLGRLHTLLVNYNQLRALPEDLGALRRLSHLDASNNQLAALPACLPAMTHLSSLVLENNALSTVDPRLGLLPLRSLLLAGNPLKLIRRPLLQPGATLQLLSFLRDRIQPDAAPPSRPQARPPAPGAQAYSLEGPPGTTGSGGGSTGADRRGDPAETPLAPAGLGGGLRDDSELQRELEACDARMAQLEEQLGGQGSLSQAQTFAVKKKLALERAQRIKLQRALTQAR